MKRKYISIVLCIITCIMFVGCNQEEGNLQQDTGRLIFTDEEGNLDAISVVLDEDTEDVTFDLENGVLLKIGENQYNMVHPNMNELIGKMVSDGVLVTDLHKGKIDVQDTGYLYTESGARLWYSDSDYNAEFEAAENVITKYMSVTCRISEEDTIIGAHCMYIKKDYATFETMDGITNDSSPSEIEAVCGGAKGTLYVDGQKVDISIYKEEAEEFMVLYEENPQMERPDFFDENNITWISSEEHLMFMYAQDKAIEQYRNGEVESICVINYGITGVEEKELTYVEYYILGPEFAGIYEQPE